MGLTVEQQRALALARARKEMKSKPAKSFGQRFKDNWLPDDDPNSHNMGETVAAAINKAGEALTFGLVGDEADARVKSWLGGGTYEEELAKNRQQEAVLERDNPGTALAADIGGAVTGALIPGAAIGTLARGAGIGSRMGASALAGAGGAGTYGFMEGEGGLEERLSEAQGSAAIGAGIGAAIPVAGAAAQRVADHVVSNRAIQKAAQTASQQRAAAGEAYDAFEQAGVQISPEAMGRLQQGVTERLGPSVSNIPGANRLTPGGQVIIDAVTEMNDQVQAAVARGENPMIPLKSIEDLRRVAGDVADGVNAIGRPTRDARLGVIAVDEVDSFVNGLKAADVPIGDAQQAVEALQKARSLWSQAVKTQTIENILDKADDYLGGQASAIRNGIGSLLRNKKTSKQFTAAEKRVLRRVIGGNSLIRTLRLMGNGIGRQAQMASGGVMGGVPGLIAGALSGEVTAEVANRRAVAAAEQAKAIVASGVLGELPNAPEAVRQITEQLLRRNTAAIPE